MICQLLALLLLELDSERKCDEQQTDSTVYRVALCATNKSDFVVRRDTHEPHFLPTKLYPEAADGHGA